MADAGSDVVRVAERSRWEVAGPDGVAVLVYEEQPGGPVALLHTVVPEAWEGRGVGSALVGEAFAWARREGRQLVPVCSFVQAWLRRHPDQQDLIAS